MGPSILTQPSHDQRRRLCTKTAIKLPSSFNTAPMMTRPELCRLFGINLLSSRPKWTSSIPQLKLSLGQRQLVTSKRWKDPSTTSDKRARAAMKDFDGRNKLESTHSGYPERRRPRLMSQPRVHQNGRNIAFGPACRRQQEHPAALRQRHRLWALQQCCHEWSCPGDRPERARIAFLRPRWARTSPRHSRSHLQQKTSAPSCFRSERGNRPRSQNCRMEPVPISSPPVFSGKVEPG